MLGDLQNQSGRSTFDLESVQNGGKSLVKLDVNHGSDNSHHTTFGPWSCCLGSSRCSSWLGLIIGVISPVSCGNEKKDGAMENAEFPASWPPAATYRGRKIHYKTVGRGLHRERSQKEAHMWLQLCPEKNGGSGPPPESVTLSPHEAVTGGLTAALTPDRAALARTAPQTRRGSLLKAAAISLCVSLLHHTAQNVIRAAGR